MSFHLPGTFMLATIHFLFSLPFVAHIMYAHFYINRYLSPFHKVLMLMKAMMKSPPVSVIFAEDDDFTSMFVEDFIPNLPVRRAPSNNMMVPSQHQPMPVAARAHPSSSLTSTTAGGSAAAVAQPHQKSEVIDLLDDD